MKGSSEYFNDTVKKLDYMLHVGVNFDIIRKEFLYGGKLPAVYYYVNGFGNGSISEKIVEYMMRSVINSNLLPDDSEKFGAVAIPYADTHVEHDIKTAHYGIISGNSGVIIDGFDGIFVIDTRKYPLRSVEEPQKERVLRGSRDGFIEAVVPNCAMIRRRIRDDNLIITKKTIGTSTQTDLVVCYMDDRADKKLLAIIQDKLNSIQTESLNMGQESLIELMIDRRWYNPFPKVRYTERPDCVAAMLMEGSIIILCDNYPSAMMFPTSIFDFLQDTDDYYFPPVIGGYLKFVRILVYIGALFLSPVWYLLISNPHIIPEAFKFIMIDKPAAVPVLIQLLIVEFSIDGLKIASLNTPETLTNSLSVIGGLLLGNLAITVGWASAEVILYMSFIAVASFTQPSYELGYSFKILRMLTLVLIRVFNYWGLAAGIILTLFLIITNPTISKERGYLYPLYPWDKRAMVRLLFRVRANKPK